MSKEWREGNDSFVPGEDMQLLYLCDDRQAHLYKCGWERARQDYEIQKEENARPRCPKCGTKMRVLLSGNFCEDTEECGYHTHGD